MVIAHRAVKGLSFWPLNRPESAPQQPVPIVQKGDPSVTRALRQVLRYHRGDDRQEHDDFQSTIVHRIELIHFRDVRTIDFVIALPLKSSSRTATHTIIKRRNLNGGAQIRNREKSTNNSD